MVEVVALYVWSVLSNAIIKCMKEDRNSDAWQQQADQLIADDQLRQIHERGVASPNQTWVKTSTNWNRWLVRSPKRRQLRILLYILAACVAVVWFSYS